MVLTDGDDGLINAIHTVFPDATHMLCQWHMYKNINSKVNKVFVGDPEGAKIWRTAWYRVLEASTKAEFIAADDALEEMEQVEWKEPLYQYVYNEYLSGSKKTTIVDFWINCSLHFGKKVTSTSENAHWKLKRRLDTAISNFEIAAREGQREYDQRERDLANEQRRDAEENRAEDERTNELSRVDRLVAANRERQAQRDEASSSTSTAAADGTRNRGDRRDVETHVRGRAGDSRDGRGVARGRVEGVVENRAPQLVQRINWAGSFS